MRITERTINNNFETLPVSDFWSNEEGDEIRMHKIHAYPAKFPSLVATKSIKYTRNKGKKINKIADVFCGCGTTALEARKADINFWGCDINPVATLITRVKSHQYYEPTLVKCFNKIIESYKSSNLDFDKSIQKNERIKYWFDDGQIIKLSKLLASITQNTPKGKYRNFFLCAFSNILKSTSRWLTKSIKPQIDPNKAPADVEEKFTSQFEMMKKANQQSKKLFKPQKTSSIKTGNFLELSFRKSFADLIVTSPPYVTSYEYADLHQLSTLWLGYVDDYRDLREGTIGSLYHTDIPQSEIESLPFFGQKIYEEMKAVGNRKSRSVAKYFIDISNSVKKIHNILKPEGQAVFVIGNTEYKGVKVDNAKFLAICMLNIGFKQVEVKKRKISSKILTPYRDKKGRFSSDRTDKKVYSYEFVITGER
jgi:DNA modification methylase